MPEVLASEQEESRPRQDSANQQGAGTVTVESPAASSQPQPQPSSELREVPLPAQQPLLQPQQQPPQHQQHLPGERPDHQDLHERPPHSGQPDVEVPTAVGTVGAVGAVGALEPFAGIQLQYAGDGQSAQGLAQPHPPQLLDQHHHHQHFQLVHQQQLQQQPQQEHPQQQQQQQQQQQFQHQQLQQHQLDEGAGGHMADDPAVHYQPLQMPIQPSQSSNPNPQQPPPLIPQLPPHPPPQSPPPSSFQPSQTQLPLTPTQSAQQQPPYPHPHPHPQQHQPLLAQQCNPSHSPLSLHASYPPQTLSPGPSSGSLGVGLTHGPPSGPSSTTASPNPSGPLPGGLNANLGLSLFSTPLPATPPPGQPNPAGGQTPGDTYESLLFQQPQPPQPHPGGGLPLLPSQPQLHPLQTPLSSQQGSPAGPPSQSQAQAQPPLQQQQQQLLLWDELRQRDAQILVLQRKLGHFRSWLAGVHSKVQAANPSAINNYKRLYVGNLPPNTTEEELKQFLHNLMVRTGANAAPGNAILSCKLKAAPPAGAPPGSAGPVPPPGPGPPDKHYAFIELRSVEEASNAMAFDGVAYRNAYLKVRRPSNYDAATAMMLGPTSPDPTIDLSQLEICRTVVENSPHKLFVGGLPCEWTDDMVKELLIPYGTLKSFNLVMDKSTGKSKGYAFCEYVEEGSADLLIKNLHMRRVGSKALTVKRAMEGSRMGTPGSVGGGSVGAAGSPGGPGGAGPSGPGGPSGAGPGSGGAGGGAATALSIGAAQQQQQRQQQQQQLATQLSAQQQQQLVSAAGSPPALPLTPVGVAAMAKLAASTSGSPAGPGGSAPGAGAAAAMAAALGSDAAASLHVADAITALLQQHNAASRNLFAAAAAAAAAGGAGPGPQTPQTPSTAAAGLAAALQQFQRSTELASVSSSGSATADLPQGVGGRGHLPHHHPQLGHHPHGHPHGHASQSQQQQQQEAAAAVAAAAQEAAAQQLAAAAAAQGVGAFDLSSLTGHQGINFW